MRLYRKHYEYFYRIVPRLVLVLKGKAEKRMTFNGVSFTLGNRLRIFDCLNIDLNRRRLRTGKLPPVRELRCIFQMEHYRWRYLVYRNKHGKPVIYENNFLGFGKPVYIGGGCVVPGGRIFRFSEPAMACRPAEEKAPPVSLALKYLGLK